MRAGPRNCISSILVLVSTGRAAAQILQGDVTSAGPPSADPTAASTPATTLVTDNSVTTGLVIFGCVLFVFACFIGYICLETRDYRRFTCPRQVKSVWKGVKRFLRHPIRSLDPSHRKRRAARRQQRKLRRAIRLQQKALRSPTDRTLAMRAKSETLNSVRYQHALADEQDRASKVTRQTGGEGTGPSAKEPSTMSEWTQQQRVAELHRHHQQLLVEQHGPIVVDPRSPNAAPPVKEITPLAFKVFQSKKKQEQRQFATQAGGPSMYPQDHQYPQGGPPMGYPPPHPLYPMPGPQAFFGAQYPYPLPPPAGPYGPVPQVPFGPLTAYDPWLLAANGMPGGAFPPAPLHLPGQPVPQGLYDGRSFETRSANSDDSDSSGSSGSSISRASSASDVTLNRWQRANTSGEYNYSPVSHRLPSSSNLWGDSNLTKRDGDSAEVPTTTDATKRTDSSYTTPTAPRHRDQVMRSHRAEAALEEVRAREFREHPPRTPSAREHAEASAKASAELRSPRTPSSRRPKPSRTTPTAARGSPRVLLRPPSPSGTPRNRLQSPSSKRKTPRGAKTPSKSASKSKSKSKSQNRVFQFHGDPFAIPPPKASPRTARARAPTAGADLTTSGESFRTEMGQVDAMAMVSPRSHARRGPPTPTGADLEMGATTTPSETTTGDEELTFKRSNKPFIQIEGDHSDSGTVVVHQPAREREVREFSESYRMHTPTNVSQSKHKRGLSTPSVDLPWDPPPAPPSPESETDAPSMHRRASFSSESSAQLPERTFVAKPRRAGDAGAARRPPAASASGTGARERRNARGKTGPSAAKGRGTAKAARGGRRR